MRRGLWACALALLACGRTRLGQAQPHAIVDGTALDFGATPVLFPVRRNLLVINAGRVPLHLDGLRIDGAGFEVAPAPLEIPEGKTQPVALLFRPPATGPFRATLTLDTDDPGLPTLSVALSGTGTEAGALEVTPAALDFGRVGEGQSATREFTLRSAGQADLYLAALGLVPGTPDADD